MASPSWQQQGPPPASPALASSWSPHGQPTQQQPPSSPRHAVSGGLPPGSLRPPFGAPPNSYSPQNSQSLPQPFGQPPQVPTRPPPQGPPSQFSPMPRGNQPPPGALFGPPGTGPPAAPNLSSSGPILGGPSVPGSRWAPPPGSSHGEPRPTAPPGHPPSGSSTPNSRSGGASAVGSTSGPSSFRPLEQGVSGPGYGQYPGHSPSPGQAVASNVPPVSISEGPPPGAPGAPASQSSPAPGPLLPQPLLRPPQPPGPPPGHPWISPPHLRPHDHSGGAQFSVPRGPGTQQASQQFQSHPLPGLLHPAGLGFNRLPSPASSTSNIIGGAALRPPRPMGMALAPLPLSNQWRSPPSSATVRPFLNMQGAVAGTQIRNFPLVPPGVAPIRMDGNERTNGGSSGVVSSDSMAEGHVLPIGAEPVLETGQNDTSEGGAGEVEEKDDAEISDSWTAHKTDEGAIYYFNSITGESTFSRPAGFHQEVNKVTAQPTPISWERITGTEWALVTTDDGKKYYYNTLNQATSWQVPPEVAELRKKAQDDGKASGPTPLRSADKSPVSFSLNVPAATTGGREAIGHRTLVGVIGASALEQIKKKLQDSGAPASSPALSSSLMASLASALDGSTESAPGSLLPSVPDTLVEAKEIQKKGQLGSDSSDDDSSADEGKKTQNVLTKDEEIAQFKVMLKEKGVVPFSKWDKELPKIIFDPRFKAIVSHKERREIFEHYVKTRAEEERKEKRAAQKAAVEGFKQLLDEVAEMLDHSFAHDKFAEKWGSDPRFTALERKDRETLLSERLAPLKKAEEERQRAEHEKAVFNFKALLEEQKDINSGARWSKVKENLRADPRFTALGREHREALFDSHVGAIRAAEEAAERAAIAKKEEEERQKEKEREARKRREREEAEQERVRARARKKDATAQYQALLEEKIKDSEASWTECRNGLEKEWHAASIELTTGEREGLFREHCNRLLERCQAEFKELLAEVITLEADLRQKDEGHSILRSWTEAKKVLKSDERYGALPRREREALWRVHAEGLQSQKKVSRRRGEGREDNDFMENGGLVADRSRDHESLRQEGERGGRIKEGENKNKENREAGEIEKRSSDKRDKHKYDEKRAEKRGERKDEDKRQSDRKLSRREGERREGDKSWIEEDSKEERREERVSSKRVLEGRHREEARRTRHRSR